MTTETQATDKSTVRTKPWSRVETLSLGKGIKVPAGYIPAYYRKRASLAVLRSKDNTHYLIFQTQTGQSLRVANTKEASKAMSSIRKGELALS